MPRKKHTPWRFRTANKNKFNIWPQSLTRIEKNEAKSLPLQAKSLLLQTKSPNSKRVWAGGGEITDAGGVDTRFFKGEMSINLLPIHLTPRNRCIYKESVTLVLLTLVTGGCEAFSISDRGL